MLSFDRAARSKRRRGNVLEIDRKMIKSILLIQCICNGFLRVGSMQDWFLPNHQPQQQQQQQQQQLFTSRDYYQANKNYPYYWTSGESPYNSNPDRSKKKVKTASPQLVSKYNVNRSPLRYLGPPAINAISSYEKFHTRLLLTTPQGLNNVKKEVHKFPLNHRPDLVTVDNHKKIPKKNHQDPKPKYIRDHAPKHQDVELEPASESKIKVKKKSKIKDELDDLKLSEDGDRIEFQISGHDGPTTYVFGFDTGDGKNRQFRLEEKMKNGTVKGHYGYYDARGKLRTIKYLARPFEGYEEQHHVSNNLLPADV